jgi:hypothetical protein
LNEAFGNPTCEVVQACVDAADSWLAHFVSF